MKRLAALCVGIWLGVQVGFGYVVAPILFAQLDKQVAGQVAGQLFHVSHYLGLLVWGLAWLVLRRRSAWALGRGNQCLNRFILILLGLLAVSEFLITPTIAALKAGETTWLVNWFGGTFSVWHGVSSVFYLLQTLLGLGLVVKLLKLN